MTTRFLPAIMIARQLFVQPLLCEGLNKVCNFDGQGLPLESGTRLVAEVFSSLILFWCFSSTQQTADRAPEVVHRCIDPMFVVAFVLRPELRDLNC